MSDLLAFGQNILKSQPFSQLLGAELSQFTEGEAELRLPIKPELTQQHGFVHGGVLSYLADNCLTYAGGSVLGDCLTSEYKINYTRPAVGEMLVAQASVLSKGKRQAICECKVFALKDGKQALVAVAQGTIITVEKG